MKKSAYVWRTAALAGLACLLLASPLMAEDKDESDVFQLGTVAFSVDVQSDSWPIYIRQRALQIVNEYPGIADVPPAESNE